MMIRPRTPFRSLSRSALAFTQFGFPFLPGRASNAVERLRRWSGPSRLAQKGTPARLAAFAAMLFGWPFGALLTALRVQRAGDTPQGRFRYVADAWWLAVTRNVPPVEYRAYGLDRPETRAALRQYLFWTDLPALATLNARQGADPRDVQDKLRFSHLCEAHGLPSVPIHAAFRDGKPLVAGAPLFPDEAEFWVKDLAGSGGQGAGRWRRDGDHYRNSAGARILATDFTAVLARRDCVVQPVLANHPAIAEITNGSLASLRIVTGIRDGSAAVISAMLYLPSGNRITSVAGIGCAIDLASGMLTRALDFHDHAKPVESHPDTGNPIVGRSLPFWRESTQLAQDAHERVFGRFVFLGWDIALSLSGPLLLEANAGWSALHLQRLNGPIGRTAFSSILEAYV